MAGLRRCLALFVLALGAAQAKRELSQAKASATQAKESVSSAQSFASPLHATDKAISSQIDSARDAAIAAVPNFDAGARSALMSMMPEDFQKQVQAAMKGFNSQDKSIDPQMRDYAKMMAGIALLDNGGTGQAAEDYVANLVKSVISFTFGLVKLAVTAPVKTITELPGDLAAALAHSQPQNFAAWFLDNKQQYKDLLGLVYKEDENGTETCGGLAHPCGLTASATGVSYAPCIISNSATGFGFGATGISVTPQAFQAGPIGFNVQPQIANIQPALLYFFPAGFNLQPQGLNIAPTLIGITPGGFSATANGGLIGGSLISVSGK